MPPLTEEQLARLVPAKLLNRSLYKPVKVPVTVNYDADVIEWFRSYGKGYQTRMNAALREYMLEHCGMYHKHALACVCLGMQKRRTEKIGAPARTGQQHLLSL
ncbi:MAG: BrnA antitoxin family protein [Spirochaetales bacterium]|nr:BrnA antitoxin family protein [Spirochaetales bacterium]